MSSIKYIIIVLVLSYHITALSKPWTSDIGDGMYKNPIIHADYSDPDVIRVGDDFYMTASSFNCVPALPILHSNDLVNWKIIKHAIKIFPDKDFDIPQHGNGVWAPSIRYHDGNFYIYYGDPDQGIFMVKTADPYDDWEPPVLVKKAYGNIDPCPLWDDDGKAYLVHAFAHSRAGVKSLLQVNELTPDGTQIVDKGVIVFDGHRDYPTIEGPKFYKRNGYYYIFAPAGGVKPGWQTVLRSKHVYGPYEDKIVLAQGNTDINGPHQGGYIELENGDAWFIHFQDKDAYGRIVHLQPVIWKNGFPVMGKDDDGDGTGEPVITYKKPIVRRIYSVEIPQTSDEFENAVMNLQWQWHANYQQSWFSLTENPGHVRLYVQSLPSATANFWQVPNLLLQKFPAPEFSVTTKVTLNSQIENEKAGLIIMGMDYSYLTIKGIHEDYVLEQITCLNAENGGEEKVVEKINAEQNVLFLKVVVEENAVCTFSYSYNGTDFKSVGKSFQAKPGKWIGAKVGLFAVKPADSPGGGWADFDFFRVEYN